jgi:peptide/nickel transport system permease protein
VAQGTLVFAWAMVDLASISFLGLGVQPPTADWGVMVATGETGVLQGYPLESLSAGLCIVLVVVAVNLLGERMVQRSNEAEGR